MEGKIFTIDGNGNLTALFEQEFAAETDFQDLIASHVDLLAGDQMNPDSPRRFFLIKQEFGVPDSENGNGRWALDHLFIDQDGIPTLVEIKRRSDPRLTGSRREVIGQLLDYAANGSKYWSIESIQAAVEPRIDELTDFLDEDSIDEFWEKVNANLRGERMRLVIVADAIPDELRRIIEFLNVNFQENIEVLGIEVRHYVSNDQQLKTLVPRVLGLTSKRGGIVAAPSIQWNEVNFFEELTKHVDPQVVKVAQELLNWIKEQEKYPFSLLFGRGKSMGAFRLAISIRGEVRKLQLFTLYTTGALEFSFQNLKVLHPFDGLERRTEFMNRLNQIPSVSLPESKIDKRPSQPLKNFAGENTKTLIGELNWLVGQIKSSEL